MEEWQKQIYDAQQKRLYGDSAKADSGGCMFILGILVAIISFIASIFFG